MFEREAALHAAVRHDNVVEVFGVRAPWWATSRGSPWSWSTAATSTACCGASRPTGGRCPRRSRRTSRGRGAAAGSRACTATKRDVGGQPLGIIHRDVTPSNIYLGADGRVKLGDFGIARSSSRATLRPGAVAMLKGTFAYLTPEQVAGEPFDQRADLFSLAAVHAEMLMGKPLFAGSGQLAVLLGIRDCRIDPLREAGASLPPGLLPILERALARDPAARFPTAAALSQALAPFEPVPTAARKAGARRARAVGADGAVDGPDGRGAPERGTRARRRLEPGGGRADGRRGSDHGRVRADPVRTSSRRRDKRLGPWTFARPASRRSPRGEVGRAMTASTTWAGASRRSSRSTSCRASCPRRRPTRPTASRASARPTSRTTCRRRRS